jgi:hypothetical protein
VSRREEVVMPTADNASGLPPGPAYRASSPSNWRILSPALGSVRYISPLRST